MISSASTSARLLRLLSLLQTRRDWPGAVLADRLEISPRTVRRDVDRLRELGYSIHASMGPDGGYRLDAGSELPPLLFDDEQAIALAVALQSASVSGAGVGEAALRALTTVRQVMPSRLRQRLDALQFTALPGRPADGVDGVSPDLLIAISTAVRAQEILRFDYSSSAGRDAPQAGVLPAVRRVEPHHVVTSQGLWFLVAWDLERDDWRIFRVDRITPRVPTGPRFAPRVPTGPRFAPRDIPGGSARAFVSARFKGADAVDIWPCRGTVILHLPASAVLPFVGDGSVEDLGPDTCSVELKSWSWEALAASFGRFEAEMTVVGPFELAAAFGVLAARYGASGTRSS